jgi:hypothetical protein
MHRCAAKVERERIASSGIVYPAACGSLPWWCSPSVVGRANEVEGPRIVPRREKRISDGDIELALLAG